MARIHGSKGSVMMDPTGGATLGGDRVAQQLDAGNESRSGGRDRLNGGSQRVSVEQTLLVIDLDAAMQTGGKQAQAVQPERLSPEAPAIGRVMR